MASQVTKAQVLSIYKQLMRESQKFESYNFRNYALRRIRDAFKENKRLNKPVDLQNQYKYAGDSLDTIRRQVVIGQMFSSDKLVIETQAAK